VCPILAYDRGALCSSGVTFGTTAHLLDVSSPLLPLKAPPVRGPRHRRRMPDRRGFRRGAKQPDQAVDRILPVRALRAEPPGVDGQHAIGPEAPPCDSAQANLDVLIQDRATLQGEAQTDGGGHFVHILTRPVPAPA